MKSIMILLHCESNTGYAINPLENVFFLMALRLCEGDSSRIHFAYPSMAKGPTETLPSSFNQYILINAKTCDRDECLAAEKYIRLHDIDTLFGFDQPVSAPIYKHFRHGGIKHFISYWGAPMSSIFGPVKRALKRIEVALHRHGPDLYIFESQGMADTAVLGRGIPRRHTAVVYLGVDTDRYRPEANDRDYVYEQFGIPQSRKIFFFSGHMEERKGISVIIRAANILAEIRKADDWHILLTGNKGREADIYINMLTEISKDRVTFGGYRTDVELLHRGCYAGIIASTGWDSLTCSAIEMQSSGLPLLVSDLPGLREAIEHQRTGLLFKAGDHTVLAKLVTHLLDNPTDTERFTLEARDRAVKYFSQQLQLDSLVIAASKFCAPQTPPR